MILQPAGLIRYTVSSRPKGLVEFRDDRGLLSVVREASDVVGALQGGELPADAEGVLLWCPATDDFPIGDAVTCALVTRAEESWWVLPGPDASPVEWSLLVEDADVEGLLPCPAVDLAAARRYVTGTAVVEVPHGANSPVAWVLAAAASEILDFARYRSADPGDERPIPLAAGVTRAEALARAEDVMIARIVQHRYVQVSVAFPDVVRLATGSLLRGDADDAESRWEALQAVTELVAMLPWDVCDGTRLAAALGTASVLDPEWWGPVGVGGIALLSVDHLADSLEAAMEVNESVGRLAFTRLGSLFASHRRPHGVA